MNEMVANSGLVDLHHFSIKTVFETVSSKSPGRHAEKAKKCSQNEQTAVHGWKRYQHSPGCSRWHHVLESLSWLFVSRYMNTCLDLQEADFPPPVSRPLSLSRRLEH